MSQERSMKRVIVRTITLPAFVRAVVVLAAVLVLGGHGYETAVKGKNGFVCLVERSWTAPIDDPNFWNPKLRGPICLNPPAARSYLPHTIKKTEFVLAGQSKAQMFESIK